MANNYERRINPSQTVAKKKKKDSLRKRKKQTKTRSIFLILSIIQNIRKISATKRVCTTLSELLITTLYKQLHSLNLTHDLDLI